MNLNSYFGKPFSHMQVGLALLLNLFPPHRLRVPISQMPRKLEDCPNPDCPKSFPTGKGARVHLAKARRCSQWDARDLKIFESSSEGSGEDISCDEAEILLPWRKIKPLPKRAQAASGVRGMPDSALQVPQLTVQGQLGGSNTSREARSSLEAPALPRTSRDSSSSSVKDEHPRAAGLDIEKGENIIDEIFRNDPFAAERKKNMYYPFRDKKDLEMGDWLARSGVSMAEIDKFLKLEWVSVWLFSTTSCRILNSLQVKKKGDFSFRSAKELHEKIASLPQPPAWFEKVVYVPGGSTKKPIKLRFRRGLELFRFLYGNPAHAGHQENSPYIIWEDEDRSSRLYGEPGSGQFPWDVQVRTSLSSAFSVALIRE